MGGEVRRWDGLVPHRIRRQPLMVIIVVAAAAVGIR